VGTNLDALKETIESYEQRIEEIEERIENAPHAVTPEMQSKLETARSELNEAKNAYDQYSNIHQRVAQFIKHGSDIDIKAAKQAAQDGHITQAEWQEMTADIDNPEVVDGIKQMFLENGVTFWDSEQSVPDGNDPGAPANSDVLPVTGIPFLDESLETVGSQFGNFGEKLLSEDSTQSTTEGDPSYAKQDTGSVAENYVPGGDRPLSIGHEFKKAHDGKTSPDKDNQPQLEHEQRPQRTAEQDTPAAEAQTFTV
jgi:hypothetical protein